MRGRSYRAYSLSLSAANSLNHSLARHGSRLPAAQAPRAGASVFLPFGEAQVFYPEATEERCTAALLLSVGPVGLVRRGRGASGFALVEYVNDRPYIASSFMSVAEWGGGRHVGLRLAGECRLAEMLNHLYVLLPVLDDEKHYWVDEAEIDKLMRRGEGWLGGHPERDLITRRYLKNQASLFYPALARLDEDAPTADPADTEQAGAAPCEINDSELCRRS